MERKFSSIYLADERYPALLKEISRPPKQLFFVGSLPPPDMMAIAIVGTRKATTQGKLMARQLAKELASRGIVIVSGLALGIDTAAHEGAIEAKGTTIGVLSDGLESIYPSQNTALADMMIRLGGALVSEYATKSPYYPGQFIQRNRIISGLCMGTVVIEAPDKSGTLATARFALEQGREVFVVPGPVDHPNYSGSHKLIRDGARLVASADDIWEDLSLKPMSSGSIQAPLWEPSTRYEHLIVSALAKAGKPLSVDKLSELTTLEAHIINATLATLVLAGGIKETEVGYDLHFPASH